MREFYKGKRVLVTGHTGFKGSWLCRVLLEFGAEVCGYALEPNTNPSLFELIDLGSGMKSDIGDVRDFKKLLSVVSEFRPEIVLHLAAQPLVRESYRNPRETYEINAMGTVNILEAIRGTDSVKSFLNVTTDKVYRNNEWCYGYRETDILDGYDPYSNSKSCSELITASYLRSFFKNKLPISTARAGNVIGGGDYAEDRIIPDCVRYTIENNPILIRNPNSIRPYQHVLESVFGYLAIAMYQYDAAEKSDIFNIGPNEQDCVSTGKLVRLFCDIWGENASYRFEEKEIQSMHEANFLKLDNSKAKAVLGIQPVWGIKAAVGKTIEFEKVRAKRQPVDEVMKCQIREFYDLFIEK